MIVTGKLSDFFRHTHTHCDHLLISGYEGFPVEIQYFPFLIVKTIVKRGDKGWWTPPTLRIYLQV